MLSKKRFEFLEHTADVQVVAYGSNLEEAFENAALATVEVMTDTRKVKATIKEQVKIYAEDEMALLYSWIEEILIRLDADGYIFSRFKVFCIEEIEEGFRLEAEMGGEPFDPKRHPQKVGVKAITYHLMEITKKWGDVTVQFILDI